MTLADRIVVMKERRIQQVASPAELYSRPTNLLTSESFCNSILVTLIFVVIVVFGSMLLGLATAVLCSKTFPGIRAFSTAYALPMAIASSGAAMIFKVILNPTIGVFNKLTRLDINWISDPRYALIAYALPMAIASSGAAMIFKVILNPTIGVFNKLTRLDINWISDPRYALICVAVLTA